MKKTKIELTNKRVINLPENILTLSGITEFNDIRYLSLNPITGDTQIPHKKYIDTSISDAVSGLTFSGITGASNGLIRINDDLSLGGVLNENTNINLSGNSFFIKERGLLYINELEFDITVSSPFSMIIDSDGRYVFGGQFIIKHNNNLYENLFRLDKFGFIDITFNSGIGFNSTILTIIEDSDGKYVIGGNFTTYTGATHNFIIRLNKDGSVDNTFNKGSGFNDTIESIIEDSDGKYVILGGFTTYSGITGQNRIIRLNKDGSIDNTFNTGNGFNGIVYSILEDSDGKYLIGGQFTQYTGASHNRIIRLNKDGSVDTTFVKGTGFNENAVNTIIEDSDGKYVMGGSFSLYNGVSNQGNIIRLNKNGSIDTTFVKGTGFGHYVASIIEDSDGKYLIGGSFTTYIGATHNRIIRLNKDGSVDATFVKGTGFSSQIFSVIDDGRRNYLIIGSFQEYNGNLLKRIASVKFNGNLNNLGDYVGLIFSAQTPQYTDNLDFLYNNRSLVDREYVDNFLTVTNGIGKINSNIKLGGLLVEDTEINLNNKKFLFKNVVDGFNVRIGFNNAILAIIEDSDGKYVVGGNFTDYNYETHNRIIRFNKDGSVDNTFNKGSGFNGTIESIIEDSDGKYVIGGGFTTYTGATHNRIIRLNKNGSIDTTFVKGTGFGHYVYSIIEDSDGKYVIGGNFTTYTGASHVRIIRLNKNGSVDSTFVKGTGFNSNVLSIIEDSDGKYVMGGSFSVYSGLTGHGRIIRLNKDGSIDATFDKGIGFNSTIYSIIEDSDGKYLIGGNFWTYTGASHVRIIRLNKNGSVDSTFVKGTGFNTTVESIIEDSDGKYLIGGEFTQYTGASHNRIIRLNKDGSIDTTFVKGTGFGSDVRSILEDSNERYLIGGLFTTYNGETYNRIVGLNKNGSISVDVNYDVLIYSGNTVNYISNVSSNYTNRSLVDKEYVDVNSFIDGVYTITSNNYTATTNNDFIGIQTGVTDIWLPSLPKTKQKLVISDIGGNAFSNNITIYGNGNNIKNNATYIIDSDYGSITIFWNGTFWSVISIVI